MTMPSLAELSASYGLPVASLLRRLAAIAAVLATIVALFAYAAGWLTPHALTQAAAIDVFQRINGVHPGFRRNHAKGLCFVGHFASNGRGAELSRARVFASGEIPVNGRFALAGGQPFVADAPQTVRSLAVQFLPPDGEEWRTGTIDIPVFPVQNAEQFIAQMQAAAPDAKTGKPDPAAMQAFVASHPATARALPLIQSRDVSSGFADATYNGLNAFLFVDAQGRTTPVRWSFVPEQPFRPVDAAADAATAAASAGDTNYLFDALIAAVHQGPQRWRLVLTVGQPGDPTGDATAVWPTDRRTVDVGTLVVEQLVSEDVSPTRDITFDPLILPDGIEASDDPLLSARSATYAVSFRRREGEPKEPSAVSPAETER
jgi:catalase